MLLTQSNSCTLRHGLKIALDLNRLRRW